MSSAAELIEALGGSGSNARCPVPTHGKGRGDVNPSLSVTEKDGEILFYCHAGCSQDAVLGALKDIGLWSSKETGHINGAAKPKKQISKIYSYCNAEGELVFEKVRYIDKSFANRRPDGKGGYIWNLKGIKDKPLYNLAAILDAREELQPVVVVEGEKDVDTLSAHGFKAVTNFDGAGKWCDGYTEALSRLDVVICGDSDAPGLKHVQLVASKLSGKASRLRTLTLAKGHNGKGVKDITDFFDAGGTAAELQALIDGAAEYVAEKKESVSPVMDAGIWLEQPLENVETVLEGLLTIGDKILVVGKSKTRKSFLLLQLAICLATGFNFLNFQVTKKRRVLLVQLEIQPKWFHRRLKLVCQGLNVDPENIYGALFVLNGRGKDIDVGSIIDHAKEVKAEVVLIDPVYKLGDFEEGEAKGWKVLLNSFDKMTELPATVGYVHHDKKGLVVDEATDRGSGSGVLGRDWDSFLGITRHAREKSVVVLDSESRNFVQPDSGVCLEFVNGCFRLSEAAPVVETDSNENPTTSMKLESFEEQALGLLTDKPLPPSIFLDKLSHILGLTQTRARALYAGLRNDKLVTVLKGYRKKGETDLVGLPADIEALTTAREHAERAKVQVNKPQAEQSPQPSQSQ